MKRRHKLGPCSNRAWAAYCKARRARDVPHPLKEAMQHPGTMFHWAARDSTMNWKLQILMDALIEDLGVNIKLRWHRRGLAISSNKNHRHKLYLTYEKSTKN